MVFNRKEIAFMPIFQKGQKNCPGNYRALKSWRHHLETMFSGGSRKVPEKLKHVQQSALRGLRAPDQRGGVEGAGLISSGGPMHKGKWSGVPSCLGDSYKENGSKLSRKLVLVLANARTISSAPKLHFERCRLDWMVGKSSL